MLSDLNTKLFEKEQSEEFIEEHKCDLQRSHESWIAQQRLLSIKLMIEGQQQESAPD